MSLEECFSELVDPRRGQGLRHSLGDILHLVVISYMCGHFGFRGVHRFCLINQDFFIPELDLKHGIPSYVTIRDVLGRIDKNNLISAFRKWTESLSGLKAGDALSIDGKTLGSTVVCTQGRNQDFEGVVSFFSQTQGITHYVEHYRRKSKEKEEANLAREIIKTLKDKGFVFTVDALHTQKKQ